jgi:hypothetical protein
MPMQACLRFHTDSKHACRAAEQELVSPESPGSPEVREPGLTDFVSPRRQRLITSDA